MQARLIGETLIGIGQFTAAIGSGASTTTLKVGAGRLCKIVITAVGSAAFSIFDNTTNSGTALFISPTSTTVGTIFDVQMPCNIGITVVNVASGPAFTLSYD
jgi:hypothetical protein